MPIVFINCSVYEFIAAIIACKKLYETRTRNTLKSIVGQRVYLCETGKGKKQVKCIVTIAEVICIDTVKQWKQCRKACCIAKGSKYDYIQGTKKYLYRLTDIEPVPVFEPIDGIRHGRTWMEYCGKK